MAEKKTVRLTHVNGGTVSVSADKEERLIAGGLFSKPQARTGSSK